MGSPGRLRDSGRLCMYVRMRNAPARANEFPWCCTGRVKNGLYQPLARGIRSLLLLRFHRLWSIFPSPCPFPLSPPPPNLPLPPPAPLPDPLLLRRHPRPRRDRRPERRHDLRHHVADVFAHAPAGQDAHYVAGAEGGSRVVHQVRFVGGEILGES